MTNQTNDLNNLSIYEALAEASLILQQAGVKDARRDADLLLGFVMNQERAYLLTHAEEELNADALAQFRNFIARRARHEPVQYITGRQAFYNLDFEVTPAVLIPRPETELIVEAALEIMKKNHAPHVCDIGTGSGCIIVSLISEDERARGVAIDISIDALQVARRNAKRANVCERVMFLASDGFDALDENLDENDAKFSVIVSNPPYIAAEEVDDLDAEVREYEPRHALTPRQDAGDGLTMIRRLLDESPKYLERNGTLIFEIGCGQKQAIENLIDARVWRLIEVRDDLQGIPRAFVLRCAA